MSVTASPKRLFAALAISLLAAAADAHASGPVAAPIAINVVLPLTGGASFLGKAEQQALEVAEKLIAETGGVHGAPVKFIFHDDQSNPQVAVQIASQLVVTKPSVVLGSAVVATCNAMAPLMKRGPVLYCLSPGVYPSADAFMFTSSSSTRDLATAQIRYWRRQGITKLALITSTDASGQDALRNIKDILAAPENKDVELLTEVRFNPGDVSVSAQIQSIKSKEPQALIAWSTGASIGTVFKAIVEAGLNIPVATTDGNMTYAQMTQYAAILPKELYIPSPQWPKHDGHNLEAPVEAAQHVFFRAFEKAGIKPDIAAALSWDPAMIVVHALRSLPPGASAEEVRAAIAGLGNFAGISGTFDFTRTPQRGLDDNSVLITRWNPDQGTWNVVSKPRGIPLDR